MDKVVLNVREPFGGRRIAFGQVSVDLWNDGVVLGAAWSMSQPEIEGTIFGFRGTLTRTRFQTRSLAWRLEQDGSGYVDHYATRADALQAVRNIVTLDAFHELNRIEAAR